VCPRLFSRGRQNFPGGGGGAKTYYLPKKCTKTYYFLSKKHTNFYQKNILFWPAKVDLDKLNKVKLGYEV